MKKYLLAIGCICLLFIACEENEKEVDPQIRKLYGNETIFLTNRIANPGDANVPSYEFDEEDYAPIANYMSDTFRVFFSTDGQSVNIFPDSIGGYMHSWDNNKLYFNLSEGLFAGGRFMVWTLEDGYEAELTIYGSGVPIISSFRGPLSIQ